MRRSDRNLGSENVTYGDCLRPVRKQCEGASFVPTEAPSGPPINSGRGIDDRGPTNQPDLTGSVPAIEKSKSRPNMIGVCPRDARLDVPMDCTKDFYIGEWTALES